MDKSIVFFDGDCGLCSRAVQFILKHEKNDRLLFSPLESTFARKYLTKAQLDLSQMDSMVLSHNGEVYTESDAALRIVVFLNWYWQPLCLFWLVPPILRNAAYRWIAKRRSKFGIMKCNFEPRHKSRFISTF
jgi:predicted DCC family thiol-disulfide oxidoreductase YuxK